MNSDERIPVLVIAYKRHAELRRCLAYLVTGGIRTVFVAMDGPRSPKEAVECNLAREVISEFSCDFEIRTRFATSNHGCREWVSSSITWFFSLVEFGIVVEEDILLDSRFIEWCKEARHARAMDGRIMHLNSFFPSTTTSARNVTHLTKYPTSWGWATWRDAWSRYEDDLSALHALPFHRRVRLLEAAIGCGWLVALHYTLALQMAHQGKLSSWAYRWAFSIWSNNGVALSPGINLSHNIGFGPNATHTSHEGLDRFPIAPANSSISSEILPVSPERDAFIFSEVARSRSVARTLRMAASVMLPNHVFFWIRKRVRS